MLGKFRLDRAVQGVEIGDLLDLYAVQETGEGVTQLKGAGRVQVAVKQVGVVDHQPRQLEPPSPGRDRRRQVQGHVPRFERRLALVQVAEGADLRQQQGLAARHRNKGLGQGPRAAPGRGEDQGVGQGLGAHRRKGGQQAAGEILDEGPVGRNGEPARPGGVQETHGPNRPGHSHGSRASRTAHQGCAPLIFRPPGPAPPQPAPSDRRRASTTRPARLRPSDPPREFRARRARGKNFRSPGRRRSAAW